MRKDGDSSRERHTNMDAVLGPQMQGCHASTHLNGVPSGVLSHQQPVTFAVQLVDPLFFGLQVPVDEILQQGRHSAPGWQPHVPLASQTLAHLILAPAAGVVKVAVAPVILHAALGLLVQPV